MEECLTNIIQGKVANIPVYDFKLNSRVVDKYRTVYPNQVDVVLFEGILTFYNPKVKNLTCCDNLLSLENLGPRFVQHEAVY